MEPLKRTTTPDMVVRERISLLTDSSLDAHEAMIGHYLLNWDVRMFEGTIIATCTAGGRADP